MAGSGGCTGSSGLVILLDTNVISAVMQNQPDPAVVCWLDDQSAQDVWLPSVVVFELRYGVAILPAGQRRRSLQQGLDQLLEQLVQDRIAPLDGLAAHRAAVLAAERKAKGRSVDLRDTLIAGIALARGAQLATRNTRHFSDTTIGLINPFPD
ncbi:type II toxin-antitoxin system VapC family toxin [Synechococcus sp. BSF8S]|nr:type II toxin-antitoxin system VapC family toxin [Synechococcus sp. BSF8S]MBC1265123.1 type II toxin-antitoxin system VapC family toxin [Synechococcus sp. BSA11S]